MPTFFKRRGYHRGPSKSSPRANTARPYARPPQTTPLPSPACDPSFAAEYDRAVAGKPVIFVSACSSEKSKKKKQKENRDRFEVGMHGVDAACLGDTALSPPLFFSPRDHTRARAYVCDRTACGCPRLASGLYRDYICKTIRLNHFLNKRARGPFPPPAPNGPGVR